MGVADWSQEKPSRSPAFLWLQPSGDCREGLALLTYCCAQEFLVHPRARRLGNSHLDWEENGGYLDLQMRWYLLVELPARLFALDPARSPSGP